MSEEKLSTILPTTKWQSLGIWNVYFLFKFGLFYFSLIELHILENLALIAFLVLPIENHAIRTLKHLLGICFAVLLLHHDSYLPPLSLLLNSSDLITSFSMSYLIELISRIVSWQATSLILVSLVTYLYFSQWVRFTGVNIIVLLCSGLIGQINTQDSAKYTQQQNTLPSLNITAKQQPISVTDPASALARFYAEQKELITQFPTQFSGANFDLIVLNVCSLGWDDLDFVGMDNHPLLQQFDVVFENFNSATSYSGPAATRLLNASCGHKAHDDLYANKPKQCNLFGQLEQLGFQTDLAMNHNGFFDSFLPSIRAQGGLNAPLQSLDNIKVMQRSFDGSPIYSDGQVLTEWLRNRAGSQVARHALYFNSISLHDGNLLAGTSNNLNSLESYGARAQTLFKDFERFFETLSRTGKNYLVVMVPEHGAALRGDQMQFAGLREIPSPAIVNVPVGIKFISSTQNKIGQGLKYREPVSYFALSELIARTLHNNPFDGRNIDLEELLSDLPQSTMVAENKGTKMIVFDNKPFIQLDGESWQRYPNQQQ
ncbi:FIG002337: predicted inner membrane protein [Pseudoalteromonas luteoviolacea B = ATCC 29581]|nr:FIG002337: predicted inner membrane protein [Pseudoalteromonas luteoviolacea B = ATCC 29581]